MRFRGLLAAAALALSVPAQAVFVASQMDRVDPEPLFNEAYFLSLRSFEYPAEWDRLWAGAAGYRINAASLDCCRLLLRQDLRFEKSLTKTLVFRYRFEQVADQDYQELHNWLELEKGLAGGFSAAVFGEPTYNKGDADAGLKLLWGGGPVRAWVSRNFVDFDFNRRSGTRQRYDRRPITDEARLYWAAPFGAVSAGAELDWPLRREDPAAGRSFWYRRTRTWAQWQNAAARARYSYEFERKGDLAAPDPTGGPVDYSRKVHSLLAAAVWESGADSFEAGHELLLRAARADRPAGGSFYRHWESAPFARWRRRTSSLVTTELAAFLAFGEDRRRSAAAFGLAEQKALALARLGTGVDYTFSPTARIGLYGTWKLDDPAHPWGGGNIRALILF